ncbi:hypothetical protein HYU22_03855 [Candidatus Woesearchaeota archaeon]|nr:hypothetical protein [Candidatus Woesearchaeota archaeon]
MTTLDRKAITPLMATFLLISFAVAVGVVIMNLGRAQVDENAQCAVDIGMGLASIGGVEQLCYDQTSKTLKFTVENGVNIKITGLIVNIIDEQKAESFEFNTPIIKAGNYLGSVKYNALGSLKQVKISPKVLLHEKEEICTEQALVTENIHPC